MGLVWNPWALLGILVLVFAWSMAALVFLARPHRPPNRRLALQLAMEGFVVAVLAGGVWIFDDATTVWALTGAATFLVWPKLWAYFSFLATLPTPLARHLQSPWRLRVFLALTLLAGLTWFIRPEWYYLGVVPVPFAPWAAVGGTGFIFIMQMWGVMWLVGLTFAVSAVRHAPTPLARRQAKAYLVAFGTRDVLFAIMTVVLSVLPTTSPWFLPVFMLFPTIWLVYIPLVGYGILRTQLFDIDIKIKRTVSRGTVAAIIVAIAFVVSEGAAQVLSQEIGPVMGLAAAGMLVFAMAPLQRAADRLTHAAMPNVDPASPTYVAYRKMEVYRAALEGALEDGDVTDKERAMLARLRGQLGIPDHDANALEADVRASARGASA